MSNILHRMKLGFIVGTAVVVVAGMWLPGVSQAQMASGSTAGTIVLEELPGNARISCILPQLNVGTQNRSVFLLQMVLKQDGYYPEGLITGYYGKKTQQAVQRFQEAANLVTSNGSLDAVTAAQLNSRIMKLYPKECGVIAGSATSTPSITSILPTSGKTGTMVALTGSNFQRGQVVSVSGNTDAGKFFIAQLSPSAISPDGTKLNFLLKGDPGMYDISVGFIRNAFSNSVKFKIIAATSTPSITMSAPQAGEVLKQGQVYTIRWSAQNIPSGARLIVDVFNGTTGEITDPNSQIASNLLPSVTSYAWTVRSNDGSWGVGMNSSLVQKLAELLTSKANAASNSYVISIRALLDGKQIAFGKTGVFTISPTTPGVQLPVINSISPTSGGVFSTTAIYGTGFTGATSVDFYQNNVLLAQIQSPSMTVADAGKITFTLPASFGGMMNPGTYQVRVATPAGGSNSVNFAFTTQNPTSTTPGQLTLGLVSGAGYSPAQNQIVNVGTLGKTYFAFKTTAYNESIKIRSLKITVSKNLGIGTLANIRLYEGTASTPFAQAAQLDSCVSGTCSVTFSATDNLLSNPVPTTGVVIYVKADIAGAGIATLGDDFKFSIATPSDMSAVGTITGTSITPVGAPAVTGVTYVVPQNVVIEGVAPMSAAQVGVMSGQVVGVFKVANNGEAPIYLSGTPTFSNGGSATSAVSFGLYASAQGGAQSDTSVSYGVSSARGDMAMIPFSLAPVSEANRIINGGSYRYLTIKTQGTGAMKDTYQFGVSSLGSIVYSVKEADLGYSGNPSVNSSLTDTINGLYVDGMPSLGMVVQVAATGAPLPLASIADAAQKQLDDMAAQLREMLLSL